MIEGKTKTGFEFSVDERILNDFGFLELIAKVNSGQDDLAAITLINRLLGAEGVQSLKEHVEDDGFYPVDKIAAEIAEIIEMIQKDGTVKNS